METRENLDKYGIHELRCIAKQKGIINASKYRKKDLIELILQNKPIAITSNRGRPNKLPLTRENLNIEEFFYLAESNIMYLEELNKKRNEFIKNMLKCICNTLNTKDKKQIFNYLSKQFDELN